MSTRVEKGRRAEAAVADYLRAGGFVILGQNVRLGPLEIDLVAQRGPLVVVVEVRLRDAASFDGPLASITRTKRARIIAAAERLWRERLSSIAEVERMRIDVAAVKVEGGETYVEYVPGAIVAEPSGA